MLIVNRASRLFQQAWVELKVPEKVTLVYYNTHQAPPLPPLPTGRVYQIAPRRITNQLDNKRILGLCLNGTGVMPETFTSISQLLATQPDPEQLWFMKSSTGTGSQQVTCYRTKELAQVKLPTWHLLQEGVMDPDLYEGCKYTLRIYALVFRQELYLFHRGIQIRHEKPYASDSQVPEAQISPAFGVPAEHLKRAYDQRTFPQIFDQIKNNLIKFQEATQEILTQIQGDDFALLGIDYLVHQDQTVSMIEINSYPNLINARPLNYAVNYPMIKNALRIILQDELLQPSQGWTRI